MNSIAEGIEGGNDILGDARVHFVDIARGNREKLRKRALAIDADTEGVWAQVLATTEAIAAATADNVALAGNQIADLQIRYARADGLHYATKLMTDGHRHGNRALRPGIPFVNMDIGTADGSLADANERVHRSDFGFGNILQPDPWLCFCFDECFHVLFCATVARQ